MMFGNTLVRSAFRAILPLALCGAALTACSDDESSTGAEGELFPSIAESTAPAFLKKGDKIVLFSPSYTSPDSVLEATSKILEEWGFEAVIAEHANALEVGKLAGTADERAEDFITALKDTSVKAIICNRGGYGAIQLIDLVDPALIKANPKWLVGFSDISTLHAMETNAGVMSIHGTMSSFIARNGGTDDNSTLVRDLLLGEVPTYKVPAHELNQKGKAEGVLVGGNMATFVPLVGSSDIDVFTRDGIILFMEEIGEPLRNIDRMMNSMELHGVFENVKGVILGEFEDSGMDLQYESTEELILTHLKKYKIPVMCGMPTGHGDVNVPLIMGAKVTMNVTDKGSTLDFNLDGDEVTVETEKLTNKTTLSMALRKMLAGKTLTLEE